MRAKDVMGSAALMAALPMLLDFLRPKANAGREDRIYSMIGMLLRNNEWKATTDDGDPQALVDYASHLVLAVEQKLVELEKKDDDEQLERIRNAHKPSECCYEGCDGLRYADTLFCVAHQVQPGEMFQMSREDWERSKHPDHLAPEPCYETGCTRPRLPNAMFCQEHCEKPEKH